MSKDDPTIEVQTAISSEGLPSAGQIRQWAVSALQGRRKSAELVVRIVDAAEITVLNQQYRGKDGATNVLSFPYESMPGVISSLLGDVVICAPVVAAEAIAQEKSLEAHWAHMVTHGVLHLLGYDHKEDDRARQMEDLETDLLVSLGFSDPY